MRAMRAILCPFMLLHGSVCYLLNFQNLTLKWEFIARIARNKGFMLEITANSLRAMMRAMAGDAGCRPHEMGNVSAL